MSKISPTQRSLKKFRGDGYLCAIVEHWNQFAKIRQDLFCFIDILAIKKNDICGIQCTSKSNLAGRIRKISDHKNYQSVKESGIRIILHGWDEDDLEEIELI
jgi:hypothetical protein